MLKNLPLLLTVSLICVVFGISESLAQEITLEPNSSENTYKTWNVNGVIDIQLRDAKHRGKALGGTHKLKYKCKEDSEVIFSRDVDFTNGNSARLRDICAKMIAEVIKIGGKKIRLRAGAGTNGFTVVKEGDSTYFKTNNVVDSNTQMPLEGSQQISVSFFPDYEPSLLFTVYRSGNSRDRLRRELLSRIENPGDEFIDGTIIVINSRNTSDDSSSEGERTDSTTQDNSSSSKSDDASVGNKSVPVRADSSLSKQNKTTASDNSLNANENSESIEAETRIVKLVKDARKNGYKTWKKDGVHYFQANNVIDPLTKKLIERLQDLSYRCSSDNSLMRIKLKLSRGNTQRVAIACALIDEPKIILADEPNSN